MNENKMYLKEWNYEGEDRVKMTYHDGSVIYVTRNRFNMSFGALIQATKAEMIRDFSNDPDFEIM